MKKQVQMTKALSSLIALTLTATACTKQRKAELPFEETRSTFAISEFGAIAGTDSPYFIETDSAAAEINALQAVRADHEAGKADIARSEVPKRLSYMFKNLKVSGQTSKRYPITFSVDRKYVTAYKVVGDLRELSPLERQFAKMKEEVQLRAEYSRIKDTKQKNETLKKIQTLEANKAYGKITNPVYLVPIFKYDIRGYGVLERAKNSLREQTATLFLRATDWENATHISIADTRDAATPVDVNENDRENMGRTYSLSRLQNKVMTAQDLNVLYQVKVDLTPSSKVHTLLDDGGMSVFELKSRSQLTSAENQQLTAGSASKEISECSEEIKKQLTAEEAQECVAIHKFVVPVQFVKLKMPYASHQGEEAAQLSFEGVNFAQNTGLVLIPKLVEPQRVTRDFIPTSNSVIAVKDIMAKEFFFRRTLQDAPVTTAFMPGEADQLLLVRFTLENDRLVVKRAENVINHKRGSNEVDKEEVMSIPATYFRKEVVDASGAPLAYPRFVKTNKENAEYVQLSWSSNTLSDVYSPVAYYGGGQCIARVGNVSIEDVDNRIRDGVLNFSYGYSATLQPSLACLGLYDGSNTYDPSGAKVQFNANLKERVSFLANDGRTEQTFGANLPFDIQRALGYGVWTLGKLNPTENGGYGREGTQENLNVKHDFRNGRQLIYTVTGLPDQSDSRRQLYVETINEVIAAWNFAYAQAFKGTSLERKDQKYVLVQFADGDKVKASLGDLDKNIIHFENKFNDNHGVLGVSQVGYNPRTGVVVADSLIIYAGNLTKYVEYGRRNAQYALQWEAMKADMKKGAMEQLAQEQKKAAEGSAPAENAPLEANRNSTADTKLVMNKLKRIAQDIRHEAQNFKKSQAGKIVSPVSLKSQTAGLFAKEKGAQKAAMLKASANSKFKYAPAQLEEAYAERALRRVLESADMGLIDIEGIVAEEMLKSQGKKMSAAQKAQLERRASLGQIRSQIKNKFKSQPGCVMATRDSLTSTFVEGTFEQSLKRALYFDLAHEMGHSQGLTHNFAGSYDKANHNRKDEGTQRNYSSVMDYFEPAQFSWDGIGLYDIRALRATHTGLIEKSSSADKYFAQFGMAGAIKGSDINMIEAQKLVNQSGGWTKIPQQLFTVSVKPYMYCTDIDVQYEPTCQRFDLGSSATELVKNLIQDHEELYINAFHGWDRLEYGYLQKSYAIGGSLRIMLQMRQFVDEYFYKSYIERADEAVLEDYRNASVLALNFLNNMIRTPSKSGTSFVSEERFAAKQIELEEVVLDKNGEPVADENGQPQTTTKNDVIIVEYRSLEDLAMNKDRLDTVGLMNSKILAMQLLTLQGLPFPKYESYNLAFSFLDLDLEVSQDDKDNMLSLGTLRDAIRGKLGATHLMQNGQLIDLGFDIESNDTIRLYAAIQSVLGLESPALRQEDNFANLFKVGSSIGRTPSDRLAVGALDVDNKSSVKMHYWSLDNANVAGVLVAELKVTEVLNAFGSAEVAGNEIKSLAAAFSEQAVGNLLQSIAGGRKDANEKAAFEAAAKSKINTATKNIQARAAALASKLKELAKENQFYQAAGLSSAEVAEQVAGSLTKIVAQVVEANITTGFALTFLPQNSQQQFIQQAVEVRNSVMEASSENALVGSTIKAVNSAMAELAQQAKAQMEAAQKATPALSPTQMLMVNLDAGSINAGAYVSGQLFSLNMTEIAYARSLRIVDFLHKLTLVTNPELNR